MFQILTCVRDDHDWRLVVVAALICGLASAAAFSFHKLSLKASQGLRFSWAVLAGIVAGAGVWATHFVAMLAYQPSMPIAYEPVGTAASLFLAITGMTIAFSLPPVMRAPWGGIAAAAVSSLAIGGMHYQGIAAIRAAAWINYDMGYVVLSFVLGFVFSLMAFGAARLMKDRKGWSAGWVMLFLGVCSLHFSSMAGVQLIPDGSEMPSGELIGRDLLAIAVSALAALILASAMALILIGRLARRSALDGVRAALDGAPLAITFYDSEARITGWNAASASILGAYGVELKIGLKRERIFDILRREGWFGEGPEDEAQMAEVYAWRNRGSEFQLPDGRWMRHDAFQTRDGGAVTVMTDISEQRASTLAMIAARDAAQAASHAKSAFLANMSHEIRTPLNGILGIADVLSATELSDRQRQMVGVVQSSGALLNALLTDLLDLARVESGAAELRPEPTDVAGLTASVCALFAGRAQQKQLTLVTDIDLGEGAQASCDPLRLRQVLGNLLNNAVKFTEVGSVTVSARRLGDRVRFEVRDTGVGFDAVTAATIFGRFQQGDDTSTRRHGGAGLGLAICQEYVRLMGGELDCASQPGAGSTFGFSLDLPAIQVSAPVAEAACDLEGEPGGFRVLIVDDNEVNRQVLSLILEAGGVDHAEVEDGAQALEAMMSVGFDVVLMDIQMPVMDGLEATRRIRAWEGETGRGRTPIYMVSANCLPEHVDAGVVAGADGHLNKPVSAAQILGVLEQHVAAAEALAA